MPLKDFGKRRRELAAAEIAATPPPKKARFEINVRDSPSTATTPAPATVSPMDETPNDTTSTPTSSMTKQQRKSNKKAKPMSNKKPAQSSNKPVAFDYSQVDFSKFQGGSKKQVNTNETSSKFHGKVSVNLNDFLLMFVSNRIVFYLIV